MQGNSVCTGSSLYENKSSACASAKCSLCRDTLEGCTTYIQFKIALSTGFPDQFNSDASKCNPDTNQIDTAVGALFRSVFFFFAKLGAALGTVECGLVKMCCFLDHDVENMLCAQPNKGHLQTRADQESGPF